MEENKIIIHQAFYGEVDRAHSCIKQTIVDPDLTSFLISFTDRPAALPPGLNLLPYLSGSAYSKYYIFTKTFADQTATRAGMVFTHALILNLSEITSINNLQIILNLFIESTECKKDLLADVQIDCSNENFASTKRHQPKYIQQIISAFITGVRPIIFSGDIATFSNALQQIWNSPNIESRKKLKFRTSFTPSDIENLKDLTIVSIQKEFLPKWQEQNIIQGENRDIVEISSHSEALFLGYRENNPFCNFLVELNVNFEEVQNYGQYEKVFLDYISIEKIEDADILRQDIRVLSKISPSSKDGKNIKDKFIEQLSSLIQNKKDTNIKALRNIDWSAYSEGEKKGKQIVSRFITNELENPIQNTSQSLSELVGLSVSEINKNWWHFSIIESIESSFTKQIESSLKTIWLLLDLSESNLNNLLSLIGSIENCDSILRKFLPEKLRPETCKILEPFAQKKNWYLLHADILLKQFSTELALVKQLETESKLSLENSIGVKYLAEKLTPEELIHCTLKNSNSKLIILSVDEILNNESLLKNIDLGVSCWLDIWISLVLKTKKIFYGLTGKEQITVFSLLDLIINGRNVDDILMGFIAETTFSDISEYKNRSKVWSLISPFHRDKLLTSTTQSVLQNLLSGQTEVNSIESEISDRLTLDSFITKFLHENRNDIDPVITIYSCFKNLKDNFLADYINNYRSNISEKQATKLGTIVRKNEFNKSARSIYDKARYNYSFYPAYEICKEIVSLKWWESILGSSQYNKKPFTSLSKQSNQNRAQLPIVVILTAIKEEYNAVRLHLTDVDEVKKNDTYYEVGIFEFQGKEIATTIIRECGSRNTTSAIETERAIQYFKPDTMFFVGIAGSRKPNDFKIGDVIFPESVLSYEGGKSDKGSFLSRPDIGLLTYKILEIAKAERNKNDWKILIKNSWDTEFIKADIGIIASGEQVVEHYESEIGDIITKHFNQTSAVEMEGFGFAKTANRQGRETSNIMIGIVRGISDIIEQPTKGRQGNNNDRRPANAKKIASDTAAAFAFWLILKTYE